MKITANLYSRSANTFVSSSIRYIRSTNIRVAHMIACHGHHSNSNSNRTTTASSPPFWPGSIATHTHTHIQFDPMLRIAASNEIKWNVEVEVTAEHPNLTA